MRVVQITAVSLKMQEADTPAAAVSQMPHLELLSSKNYK